MYSDPQFVNALRSLQGGDGGKEKEKGANRELVDWLFVNVPATNRRVTPLPIQFYSFLVIPIHFHSFLVIPIYSLQVLEGPCALS